MIKLVHNSALYLKSQKQGWLDGQAGREKVWPLSAQHSQPGGTWPAQLRLCPVQPPNDFPGESESGSGSSWRSQIECSCFKGSSKVYSGEECRPRWARFRGSGREMARERDG